MAKTTDIERGGILFTADWKLFPVDSHNWELCHRYASTHHAAKDAEARWHRCGRFYSYSGVGHAMAYVADELMKEKRLGEAAELRVAMAEWQRTFDAMVETRLS